MGMSLDYVTYRAMRNSADKLAQNTTQQRKCIVLL